MGKISGPWIIEKLNISVAKCCRGGCNTTSEMEQQNFIVSLNYFSYIFESSMFYSLKGQTNDISFLFGRNYCLFRCILERLFERDIILLLMQSGCLRISIIFYERI